MDSLLNQKRPPAFCPGCAHETVSRSLDRAFQNMGLKGDQVALVSDIGCSGLFDTFFNTHAFHGLHGRALTYATGIKLAQPKLHVIVTMGDGGLGIGGAHLLSACRRNIDITLLILNNFNYGMTGGQFSSTTPQDAEVGSGFLNRLEKPMDVCRVVHAAGGSHITRASAYDKNLPGKIEAAIRFNGFAVLDIWGVCPGRYTRKNRMTPASIEKSMNALHPYDGPVPENIRQEYGQNYRETAAGQAPAVPLTPVEKTFAPVIKERQETVILGSAGQRIVTAGELLCYAGITAGLNATQKNDYPITVLRGHSISEVVLSPDAIDFTGIENPKVILALGQEGVNRKKDLFKTTTQDTTLLVDTRIEIPDCRGSFIPVDFKEHKIKSQDMALAVLGLLSKRKILITTEMLEAALRYRFKGKVLETAIGLIKKI